MSTDRVLLAVDISYQTYRAAAAHRTLTSEGVFTGGLYGFFGSLAKQIVVTRATHVIGCLDVKPYLRSREYPDYKLLRKRKADDGLKELFEESWPLVVEALGVIGIPTMGFKGFESDDCIAWLAESQRHRFWRIYASSNDSDLHQLLRFDSFRLLKGGEMTEEVSADTLAVKTGLTPAQYMLAASLMGTHNDVAGIPGVGEVKSINAVRDPGLMRRYREQHGTLIDRNQRLQKLPHAEFPHTTLPPMGRFDARRLYRFCGRFDIEVTGQMVKAFEQVST